MPTTIFNLGRAIAERARGRAHIERLPVLEWMLLFLISAILLATLYLIWLKANTPSWP